MLHSKFMLVIFLYINYVNFCVKLKLLHDANAHNRLDVRSTIDRNNLPCITRISIAH